MPEGKRLRTMRSQHVKMPVEEFHRLPWVLGWKHEYYGGKAYFTPAHVAAVLSVPVAARHVQSPLPMRPVRPADARALTALFVAAFVDTVEYCDWTVARVRRSARECIAGFLAGKHGDPLPASRAAEADGRLAGAALIALSSEGPMLEILFIAPEWQRHELATALVAASLVELAAVGEARLFSRCDLANEPSMAWHRRFGFVDEPDRMLTERRLRVAQHEVRRRQELGDLDAAEHRALDAQCARLTREVRRLEALEEREGYEAAAPILRIRPAHRGEQAL